MDNFVCHVNLLVVLARWLCANESPLSSYRGLIGFICELVRLARFLHVAVNLVYPCRCYLVLSVVTLSHLIHFACRLVQSAGRGSSIKGISCTLQGQICLLLRHRRRLVVLGVGGLNEWVFFIHQPHMLIWKATHPLRRQVSSVDPRLVHPECRCVQFVSPLRKLVRLVGDRGCVVRYGCVLGILVERLGEANR